MKEIRDILDRVAAFADDERAVLATVVDLQGSGYRRPGARMLIEADGGTSGTVSGGCLEADVLERAKRVLASGRAEVFTYDTAADETSVFSLNMGCRGVIRILLEPIGRDSELIGKLRSVYDLRETRSMATVITPAIDGDAVGRRVFFRNVADREEFASRLGDVEVSFETLEPPIHILLFGAGADAVPMARIAAELGWEVTVFDHRPWYLTADRFPGVRGLVSPADDGAYANIASDTRTAAVIMTHNYGRDRGILPMLLRSDAFYIGALGPKRRTEQLLGELAATGETFTDEHLSRLYAPVGLDIGADTPEAIAMSIAAEIQGVLSRRIGGHLRDREGSIYDRK